MRSTTRKSLLVSLVALSVVVAATLRLPASTIGLPAGPQIDPRYEELASLVSEKMEEYGVTGVAFGVVKDGDATLRGFGVTSIEDPQPITPDTIFPIASISKTVATTAMMRLVEAGKVDLNSPVARYLPEFRVRDEAASRDVTVLDLLTHTSGWEGQLGMQDRGAESLAYFVETMDQLPQLAPPGRVWSYNNAGFLVAGRVIEVVTEQSIHDALDDLVFEPLGLSRAFTRVGDAVTYRFALGHRSGRGGRGGPSVIRPFRLPALTAGGVAMSLQNILEYAKFHLGDGRGQGGAQVLTRASLEQMRTAQITKLSTDDEMGIGWHLRDVGGVLTAAHGGTLGGHRLLLEIVPERNLAFSILTNHSGGTQLIQDVERAVLQLYEDISMDSGHTVTNRGVGETVPEPRLLDDQPDASPYLGVFRRPPLNTVWRVRAQDGRIAIENGNGGGMSYLAFYGTDRAIQVADDGSFGQQVDFIRAPDGTVQWIRRGGRIGRKD